MQMTPTSSSAIDDHPPSHAFDGDLKTRWESENVPHAWLEVELGRVERIFEVRIRWQAHYCAHYNISSSLEGGAWELVWDVTQEAGRGGSWLKVHSVYHAFAVDRLRIECIQRPWMHNTMMFKDEQFGISVYEITIAIEAASPPSPPTPLPPPPQPPPSPPPYIPLQAYGFSKAYASSTQGNNFLPIYAVDGNIHTRWESHDTDNNWFKVDFASAQSVYGVRILWFKHYCLEYDLSFQMEGSRAVKTLHVMNAPPPERSSADHWWRRHSFPDAVIANGVVISCTARPSFSGSFGFGTQTYGISIYELSIEVAAPEISAITHETHTASAWQFG